MDSNYDFLAKVLLVGDFCTGKSSLLERYVDDSFTGYHKSHVFGWDFRIKTHKAFEEKKIIKLQIWDGSQSAVRAYYRGSHAIFLTFDLTDLESFEYIKNFIREYQVLFPEYACFFLVGNKNDLNDERAVGQNDIDQFVNDEKNNISSYFSVSAKTGFGVNDMFQAVSEITFKKHFEYMERSENKTVSSNNILELSRVSSSRNNVNPTPKEVLVARFKKYTMRIEGYDTYSHGFWFDKQARTDNRRANYILVKSLLEELNESDGSIEAIEKIIHNIDQKRENIINQSCLWNNKGRGINSIELNQTIERAKYFVKRGY